MNNTDSRSIWNAMGRALVPAHSLVTWDEMSPQKQQELREAAKAVLLVAEAHGAITIKRSGQW